MIKSALKALRASQGSIAVGSVVMLAFNGLAICAYGFGTILVNRRIGPEQAGHLTWFVSVSQLIALFADVIGVYYSNLQLTASRSHFFSKTDVRTTVLVYGAGAGFIATTVLMCVPLLRNMVFPAYAGFRWTILAILGTVGTMLINQIRGLLWSQGSFILVGALWLARTLSYAVIGVIGTYFFSWTKSVDLAQAYALASWICVLAACGYFAHLGLGQFNWRYLELCWRTGIRGATQNVLTLAQQRSDQFIISRNLTWTDLGLYSVVVNLADVISQIPGCIGMLTFSEAAVEKDRNIGSRRLLARVGKVMGGIGALGLVLYLVGPFVILPLYGPKFVGAVNIIGVYIPALVFQSGVLLANSYISARGYPAPQLIATGCALTVNLIVSQLLVRWLGVNGVALGLSISLLVWLVLLLSYISRDSRPATGAPQLPDLRTRQGQAELDTP